MKKILSLTALGIAVAGSVSGQLVLTPIEGLELLPTEARLDSLLMAAGMRFEVPEPGRLTDSDYEEVAAELGVEVAAIKAVVDIETGHTHTGFWKPRMPLLNFDTSIYSKRARLHGVNLSEVRKEAPVIFSRPDTRKYGDRQGAMYARLKAAEEINRTLAYESGFWGMFQIGGFNWDKCGCSSLDEFMERMRRSERDQLELFAEYCRSRDLVKYIRSKNWAAFSLRYNGPGYRRRGYHTRMAAAYRKYLGR